MRLSAILLLLGSPALAAELPHNQLRYDSLTAARLNPLGLQEQINLGWRHRLSDSDNVLLDGTYLDAGLTTTLTPAYARIGPRIQLFPLAVLRLTAAWEGGGYFGSFEQMQGFSSTAVEYSDSALEDGEYGATTGSMAMFEARVQAKVSVIADRTTITLNHFDIDLPGGQTTFYEQMTDTLAPNHGWVLRDDTDLLYVSGGPFNTGVRWSWTRAMHGDSSSADTPTQRIGPLAAWTFFDEPDRKFNQPTVVLIANWWIQHPYRTGQDTPAALPYLVLAFAFNGGLT